MYNFPLATVKAKALYVPTSLRIKIGSHNFFWTRLILQYIKSISSLDHIILLLSKKHHTFCSSKHIISNNNIINYSKLDNHNS